jgi:predicted nucleotidyltransferase
MQKTGAHDALVMQALLAAVAAVERASVDYLLVGGLAAACFGRPRASRDVDVLVRPADVARVLDALSEAGFQREEVELDWLDKVRLGDVDVDVINRVTSDIYLDDELMCHARRARFDGRDVCVASPEDLIVIKASVHTEQTPRHWHDALGLLTTAPLDWDYLLHRSRYATRRVLSLLIYAESTDAYVPREVVVALVERRYREPGSCTVAARDDR